MNRIVLVAVLTVVAGLAVAGFFLLGGPSSPSEEEDETPIRGDGRTGDPADRGPPVALPDDVRTILLSGPEHPRFRSLLDEADRLDAAAADQLLELVGDPEVRPDARDLALALLARHPGSDVGKRLVDLLEKGVMHPDHLVFRLLETLRDRNDEDQAPRLTAIVASPAIPPESLWMISEGVRWLSGEAPMAALRQVVATEDPVRRAGAAIALLWAAGAGVSAEVNDLLRRERNPIVRHEVLRAVAERRDVEGQRYLADLVGDETADPELRAEVTRTSPRLDDGEALDRLVDVVAMGEAPPEVLRGAAEILGRSNAKGVARRVRETLRAAPRIDSRIAAVEAVRKTGDREGLDDVRGALADGAAPPKLRAALARALGEVGGRADRTTLQTMIEGDPEPAVREAAKKGLERLDEILMSFPDR